MKKIAITSGDTDGIGLEVSLKALKNIGPSKSARFYLFRPSSYTTKNFSRFLRGYDVVTLPNLAAALAVQSSEKNLLFDIASASPPPLWVEEAAQACLQNKMDSLVTAPLSKQLIKKSGLTDLGHTDILKRLCRSNTAFMTFVGKKFNVLLATGHIPINKISSALLDDTLIRALGCANSFRLSVKSKKPIGLLGLNPHAGDQGLIGKEETDLFKRVLAFAAKKNIPVIGPLVPDAAFHSKNWSHYSIYVCCYHDQGLIPFKTIHGFSGVHLTLGLPIKRTSVDHGTAKDIFGKNCADASSMIDALRWAIKN